MSMLHSFVELPWKDIFTVMKHVGTIGTSYYSAAEVLGKVDWAQALNTLHTSWDSTLAYIGHLISLGIAYASIIATFVMTRGRRLLGK